MQKVQDEMGIVHDSAIELRRAHRVSDCGAANRVAPHLNLHFLWHVVW